MQKTLDIKNQLLAKYRNRDFVADKTGVKTLEIIGATFLADAPAIIGQPNPEYIEREIAWYKSQSLNVNDIPPPVPVIWKKCATADGFINSNYGYLIWSGENELQYEHVLEELKRNPDSRRAQMIYTRPTIWTEYDRDGMSDFICTDAVQYFIRNGKLLAHVRMRSNDVVFGYRNDFAWQNYVLDLLSKDLNISAGEIIWTAGSFHVYERHFDLLEQ